MSGLWFKVAADLPRHGKSLALAHRLGDKRAWAYVVAMWAWFCEQAGEGIRTGPNAAAEIAGGAGYDGDPEHFCAQMVAVGFLDVVAEGFRVHDWEEWAGYHIENQKRNTALKAESRRLSKGCPKDVMVTSEGHPSDVLGKSAGPLSTLSSAVVASGGGAGGGTAGTRDQQQARWAAAHPVCAALLETLRAGDPSLVLTPSRKAEITEQIEGDVQRLGYDRAAEVVREAHALEPNGSIAWYRNALHRAAAAPAPVVEAPLPAPDPAWLDAHPGSRERWKVWEHEVTSKPGSAFSVREQLAAAIPMFMAEFEEAA